MKRITVETSSYGNEPSRILMDDGGRNVSVLLCDGYSIARLAEVADAMRLAFPTAELVFETVGLGAGVADLWKSTYNSGAMRTYHSTAIRLEGWRSNAPTDQR